MTTSALTVTSAKKSDKAELAAMLQDYLAEFARFDHVEQDENGRYRYPFLDHYWEDPNRYPFLFRLNGKGCGFALLRFEADPVSGREAMEMAEFYVEAAERRSGMGTQAARRLWDLFPGRWIVRVLKSNVDAFPFWRRVIDDYTGGRFDEQPPATAIGGAWTFTFESATSPDMPDGVEPELVDY